MNIYYCRFTFFSNKLVFNLTSFNLNTKIPYGQDNIALHLSVSEFLSLSDFVLKILTIWLSTLKILNTVLISTLFLYNFSRNVFGSNE